LKLSLFGASHAIKSTGLTDDPGHDGQQYSNAAATQFFFCGAMIAPISHVK
jgi:hypothetical protein